MFAHLRYPFAEKTSNFCIFFEFFDVATHGSHGDLHVFMSCFSDSSTYKAKHLSQEPTGDLEGLDVSVGGGVNAWLLQWRGGNGHYCHCTLGGFLRVDTCDMSLSESYHLMKSDVFPNHDVLLDQDIERQTKKKTEHPTIKPPVPLAPGDSNCNFPSFRCYQKHTHRSISPNAWSWERCDVCKNPGSVRCLDSKLWGDFWRWNLPSISGAFGNPSRPRIPACSSWSWAGLGFWDFRRDEKPLLCCIFQHGKTLAFSNFEMAFNGCSPAHVLKDHDVRKVLQVLAVDFPPIPIWETVAGHSPGRFWCASRAAFWKPKTRPRKQLPAMPIAIQFIATLPLEHLGNPANNSDDSKMKIENTSLGSG